MIPIQTSTQSEERRLAFPDDVSGAIDRISLTLRPRHRVVMRQQWRHLLFLHWSVPVETLRPLIPAGLQIDTFEGKAYVGLVPFTMRNVRPVWSPSVAPLSHFHEVNVRTYVHHQGQNPGVWFFSLDAANALAVRLARAWFKLPYHFARMQMNVTAPSGAPDTSSTIQHPNTPIDYASERLWPTPLPAACNLSYTPQGDISPAVPGTLDHFLVERYLLYAYKNAQLFSGQVHHRPYPVQSALVHSLSETLLAAAGVPRPDLTPLVHYASGVDVDILALRRV